MHPLKNVMSAIERASPFGLDDRLGRMGLRAWVRFEVSARGQVDWNGLTGIYCDPFDSKIDYSILGAGEPLRWTAESNSGVWMR